jgi:putative peptidoglycan lipid II flippase
VTDPPRPPAADPGIPGGSAAEAGTPGTPRAASHATRIIGAAALIAGLTVLARIAGFGRTVVFVQTVGANPLGDLYNAANTIPNVVFELVAGGALASLVVPLLAGAVAAGDTDRVNATASALLTWLLTLLIPMALLVALLADPIVGLLDQLSPHAHLVGARMLRIFAPQLPLYGIGIVLTGVLQAHHRFAWPVIAPLLSSVTVILAYLTYAEIDGARSGLGQLTPAGELVLSLGTTAGVAVLSLCLFIPVRRLRLRLRPRYRFPGDAGHQVVRLGWAGAATVGSQQLMVLVVLVLATGDGEYTGFILAQTLYLLPWAVLAVPLATAAYPTLAARAEHGDEDGYRATLSATVRPIALLACLGAAALAALAVPVAVLLRVPLAAEGIAGLAPGLLGYALFAVLSRALYARGATASAALATAIGWAVAAIVAVLLAQSLPTDHRVLALALANSAGMLVLGVLLVAAVRRRAGPAAVSGLGRSVVAGIVAAGFAALAGRGVVVALGRTPTVWGGVLECMLGGAVLAVVFVVLAFALDRDGVRRLMRRG